MAENKKSVLLYCDIIHTVKSLTDEEAGKLFKHYLEYINDLNPISDRLTELLFEPIKQNLKRDLKKWEDKSERNSEIAKAGWVMRKDANAYERIKPDAKHTDKDTVTVKDTVKDFIDDKFKNSFEKWMSYKKDRKEKYKSIESEKQFYYKLLKLSNNNPLIAEKIINDSMANNYAGIFEPKEDKKAIQTTVITMPTRPRDI